MRGEYHSESDTNKYMLGSPPLARGVHRKIVGPCLVTGITPACAGSTHLPPVCVYLIWDHPRLRGEYQYASSPQVVRQGSPPLARGVLVWRQDRKEPAGITPACAGSTVTDLCCLILLKDHPRLRGEYTKKSLILRDPCLLV